MKPLRTTSALLAAALLFSACKKDKDEVKPSAIIGTWTFSQTGEDLNNNNVPEATELEPFAIPGVTATVVFKSNNTYTGTTTFMGQVQTETGTYKFANNKLFTDGAQGKDTVNIHTLTSSKLIIRDAEDTPATWVVLTK